MPGAVRAFQLIHRFKAPSISFASPSAVLRRQFHSEVGSIPTAKNVFYRVSGLPRGAKSDDVCQFIKSIKTAGLPEPDPSPTVEILPACVQGFRETTSIAIVKFRRDQEPQFLKALARNRLGEITLPYKVNGVPGSVNITFDRHFHGFTQLYPTRPDRPVLADIIAITGMDGHAYGSWMSRDAEGDMWLRNFLSDDLPSCRTMIYGYESKLLAPNINQLQEYGRLFLAEIEKVRDTVDLQQRPLIFICHSYGGIILSYSLVRSSNAHTMENENQASRHSVYKSTYGMLFFGTPHRGSRKEDLLKMVQDEHPNRIPALLQSKPDSGRLLDQLGHLKDIIGDRRVGSFYELKPTPSLEKDAQGNWKRSGTPHLQVNEDSATLQLPAQERKIPVDANHRDMVKFASKNNQTYTTVRKMLQEFVLDAPPVVQRRYNQRALSAVECRSNVPFARSASFVGREGVLNRLEQIFGSPDYHNSAALTGLGGIGKSAIAINYARRHQQRHREASLWWVQAATVATFTQSYREIADILELDGRNEPKADILSLVHSHLSDEKNGPWLLILDNADDRSLFEPATYPNGEGDAEAGKSTQSPLSYLPQCRHGSILITSRDRSIAEDFAGSTSSIITVGALDDIDAVDLLRKRSRDWKSSDQYAERLVKSLDNIPLAITQAAGFVSGSGTSIEWFNNTLNEKGRHRSQDSAMDINVPPAMLLTWQLSFDVIRRKYRDSVKLLGLMSVFHNDDVPRFLFVENMPEYSNDPRRFLADMTPLLRFNLVIIDGKNFDMHRLVQVAARSWLANHHELHQSVREGRALMADAFPDISISSGLESIKKCLALLPHASAALTLNAGPENLHQLKQTSKLLHNMANCEYFTGDYRSALRHSITAKEIQSSSFPADDQDALKTTDLISRLRIALGEGEKAIREVDLGLLLHHGNPGARLALLEERARLTLDMALSSGPGPGRPDKTELAKAETQARHVLRLMSADDVHVAESHRLDARRTLARAVSFQGEPEQAEALFRQVLARRKQLWGLGHIDTLKSLFDLGECLARQGRFEEAIGYFETTADGLRKFAPAKNALASQVESALQRAKEERQRGGGG
ncbi:hypothetical protein B0T16DRAFT_497485 [Cercophora newfieldiana]|uniref:ORC1/DEAH AAA+ ATPase domain-containing protein n=1 Tax=Cercophora newfieldiana TaxID=92897 RepID=A0AA39XSE1_9PEZI|nr:hypothetical protein B0T16DRAFT_497485 [Cercophora newfieldiana]